MLVYANGMKEVAQKKAKQKPLPRLLAAAGSHKILIYASWVLSAVSALVALVPFVFIWLIVREVLAVAPDFSRAAHITQNGVWSCIAAAAAFLVYIAALICSHLGAFRIASNLKKTLLAKIALLPLGTIEKFGSGRLRKIVNETSSQAETFLAHRLPDKYNALATPVGLLLLLFYFDWHLGLLSLVPVALGFVIMSAMTGERMKAKLKEYQNALDAMSNQAVEYVRGIPVVKTFAQTIFTFRAFKQSIDDYGKWVIAYTRELRLPMILFTACTNGVFVFLIAAGLYATREAVSQEFLLNLIYYIVITPVISVTLMRLMYMSEDAMVAEDALSRMDEVLNAAAFDAAGKGGEPKGNDIELKHVSFSYDGKTEVLHDITLSIPEKRTVAFVGASGGGKSTLASLIARFFDATAGEITLGGTDVRTIPQGELMRRVSFVFQDAKLLNTSILENVRLSRPEASEAEVMDALEKAQCADIIRKLPDGIHTQLGAQGVYLSGGEKQRVAIARTLLKDAPIVILDEATAFTDPDNEAKVQRAFSEMARSKTVIMIAHRLSTVRNADEICVIADGRIAERGSFEKLSAAGGLFSAMWRDYQKSVEWKI